MNLAARLLGGAVGVTVCKLLRHPTAFQRLHVCVDTAVFTEKLTALLPANIAGAALQAGLPASSLAPFVGGIATGNVTLALSAPGVTPEILQAGAAGAALGYALALKVSRFNPLLSRMQI